MCALQAISNFLNVTSSTVSSLGLFSPDRSSDKPEWAIGRRDVEPPEYMEDFEKNIKDFMEQQNKSRSIELYGLPKSATRKKRSLGTETQVNIPRSKRKLSKKDLRAMIREKRDAANCQNALKNQTFGILYRCHPDSSLSLDRDLEDLDSLIDREHAYFRCNNQTRVDPQTSSFTNLCFQDNARQRTVFGSTCRIDFSRDVENRVSEIWSSHDNPGSSCLNNDTYGQPIYVFSCQDNSADIIHGSDFDDRCSCGGYTNKCNATLLTLAPSPNSSSLPVSSTPQISSATSSSSLRPTQPPKKPGKECDRKPFYYAIGVVALALGCAVLSTACCLYQGVTRRKQKSIENQSETISLSSKIQSFGESVDISKEDKGKKSIFVVRIYYSVCRKVLFWR